MIFINFIFIIFQVKDEQDEETGETKDNTDNVTEAFNGQVSTREMQDRPKLKYPEPATPGNSPARGAVGPVGVAPGASVPAPGQKISYMKHSDSSFGLHSPDSFNDDVQVRLLSFLLHTVLTKC